MELVSHPEEVMAVYRRHPHIHPYGIADVAQLWARSRWWRRGDAVVGLLDLAGENVVYAIAAGPREAAVGLALLADLAGTSLPADFVITGPTGLTRVLQAAGYQAVWTDPYDKLHLPAEVPLPAAAMDVRQLTPKDLAEVQALFDTDPDAGDFFHAGLLEVGPYVGRHRDGALVAIAGIHVVDPVNGVAAIGNVATHPDHRRRGDGRAVVIDLLHRLRQQVDIIGLNVRHRTAPARSLYDGLGFRHAVTYEEAQVGRIHASPSRRSAGCP